MTIRNLQFSKSKEFANKYMAYKNTRGGLKLFLLCWLRFLSASLVLVEGGLESKWIWDVVGFNDLVYELIDVLRFDSFKGIINVFVDFSRILEILNSLGKISFNLLCSKLLIFLPHGEFVNLLWLMRLLWLWDLFQHSQLFEGLHEAILIIGEAELLIEELSKLPIF